MKIKNIDIVGVGGIKKLQLQFNDGMNIICGTNGIGKTTILECIAQFFLNHSNDRLKRNSSSNIGIVSGVFEGIFDKNEVEMKSIEYTLQQFEPENRNYVNTVLHNYNNKVIYFNAHRDFNYIKIEHLERDSDRGLYNISSNLITGFSPDEVKQWFINRYVFFPHEGSINEQQKHNLNMAKEMFSIMDPTISFSRVKADTFDIMLNTCNGEIYFEYLSSGYKSSIYVLLGIIKEIEYRFKNPSIKIDEFDGIILIDEIDVHLHPKWQSKLVESLKVLLPKAQIIVTTHSPSVIQNSETKEIIALHYDENNEICQKKLRENKYGYRGWYIEEILRDVMGMEDTKSSLYEETLKKFDKAMDQEDFESAKYYYNVMNEMLHPKNYLRKVLQIQMAKSGELIDKDK